MNRLSFLKWGFRFLVTAAGVLGGGTWLFVRQDKFGGTASGKRLQRIANSPNYRDGAFHNQLATPMTAPGSPGMLSVLWQFVFNRNPRLQPARRIPSVRRDLRALAPSENAFVWFGHSSYFLQVDGMRILVDPVLSGRASPVSFTTKAFDGTDPYTVADLPDIDLLVITHDHWDHLDYDTVTALRPRVKRVLCALGVGAHLEQWGYASNVICEGDWGDRFALERGFTAHVLPARHFSGRGLRRNQTLWASFAVVTSSGYKIYLGGDGGYGPHFKAIGDEFNGFDLAVLENGQYNQAWRFIHMLPDQTLQAAQDLRAAVVVPVHNSKFNLALHDWDAPLRTITALAGALRSRIVTPVLGSVVRLSDPQASATEWWINLS